MPKIRELCLDAGGVLIHPDWSHFAGVLSSHGLALSAAQLLAVEAQARYALDAAERVATTRDQNRVQHYFAGILSRLGIDPEHAPAHAALEQLAAEHARENLWRWVPDDVLPALARFRSLGLQLAVVSNANGTLRHKLAELKLTPHFDLIVDSHEEGVEKPDPAIFQIALKRLGGSPESALHVGDLYFIDVVGARNAGVLPALLDPQDLYRDKQCLRVRSLLELAAWIETHNRSAEQEARDAR